MSNIKAKLKDLMLEQWLRDRNNGTLVWTTRDGKEIPIKDMTDAHLEAAIKRVTINEERKEIVVDKFGYCDFR